MPKILALLSIGLVGALTAGAAPAEAAALLQQSCGAPVVAGDADNGSSVCVVAGSDISVILTSAGDSSWSSPTVTGSALGPAMPLPTPFGRVGWQFRTIAAGPAEISTTRPAGNCAVVRYQLHVTVR